MSPAPMWGDGGGGDVAPSKSREAGHAPTATAASPIASARGHRRGEGCALATSRALAARARASLGRTSAGERSASSSVACARGSVA
jgi:hypothetical protein